MVETEEAKLQREYDAAGESDRRLTFTEFIDGRPAIDDNLDRDGFVKEVTTNPNGMFDIAEEIMANLRATYAERDALDRANTLNIQKLEEARTQYEFLRH